MTRRTFPTPTLLCLALAACGVSAEAPPVGFGACVTDLDCDDGIDCTVDPCDVTVGGERVCAHIARNDRCAAGEVCVPGASPGSGCVTLARLWCAGRQEWESCTPDDPCASGMGYCRDGVCTYETRTCPDQACMASRGCDPITGLCAYAPRPDGTACDRDAMACSVDACEAGACITVTDTCECTPDRPCPTPEDICEGEATCEDGTCVPHPVTCPPGDDPCLVNTCDPQTGACAEGPVEDGTPCPDDLACTTDEQCRAGVCETQPFVCEPRPCQAGACIEPDGCAWTAADDGRDCDDGDRCNGPDRCLAGACLPFLAPVDCDDDDPCTADACDPATGLCLHELVPDCCGNGIVEDGEDCDAGADTAGCRSCRWSLIPLTADGQGVAVLPHLDSTAVVAYQERIDDTRSRLVLRRLHGNGEADPPIEIEDAVAAPGGFRAALAPRGDGRVLLASFEQDGLVLRILDATLDVRGRWVVVPDPGVPTGEPLRLAVLDGIAFVAFELGTRPDSAVKLARVPLAGFGNDGPPPTPAVDETVVALLAGLVDLCPGDTGVLITYWRRDTAYGFIPHADFFETDLERRWDHRTGFPNPWQPGTSRCARWHPEAAVCPGFALATEQAFSNEDSLVEAIVNTRFICEENGNYEDAGKVLSTPYPEAGGDGDFAMTGMTAAFAGVGDGYLFATAFNVLRPAPATYGFDARILALDGMALALGPPVSPGPDMPAWVVRLGLVDVPGPVALLVGIAPEIPSGALHAGRVWARFIPDSLPPAAAGRCRNHGRQDIRAETIRSFRR